MVRLSRRTFVGTTGLVSGGILLAACGQTAAPEVTPTEAAPAPKAEATAPAAAPKGKEQQTVTFWYTEFEPWNFDTQPVPMAIRQEFDETSGYTLEPLMRPNGGFNDIPTVVAAGSAPDISKTQGYIQPQWGLLELVRNLNDYIRTATNISLDDVWPGKVEEMRYQGNQYALPYSSDARMIFFNTDHYLEAGLDPAAPPASWEEMEDAVLKTHKTEGGNISRLGWDPFRGSGGIHTWMVPYWQLGGSILNEDKTKYTVSNELAVEAVTWHKRILDSQGGRTMIQAYHLEQTDRIADQQFGNGELTHIYFTNANRASMRVAGLTAPYDVALYPLPNAGAPQVTYSGSWALCLPNGSQNPDGGAAWADFLYRPDIELSWCLEMDRIPGQRTVAQSEEYIGGDKIRELAATLMEGANFVASVPGAGDILPIVSEELTKVFAGEVTIAEGLQQMETRAQQAMDTFMANL